MSLKLETKQALSQISGIFWTRGCGNIPHCCLFFFTSYKVLFTLLFGAHFWLNTSSLGLFYQKDSFESYLVE